MSREPIPDRLYHHPARLRGFVTFFTNEALPRSTSCISILDSHFSPLKRSLLISSLLSLYIVIVIKYEARLEGGLVSLQYAVCRSFLPDAAFGAFCCKSSSCSSPLTLNHSLHYCCVCPFASCNLGADSKV